MPSRSRIAEDLRRILGPDRVVSEEHIVRLYSREPSGLEAGELPAAVVFPHSVEDVSRLLAYAYERRIAVYPQGSATSLSGSSVPLEGGVVLSMERMDRVTGVSVVDGTVDAEAGVRIDDLNLLLAEKGYMFPVDPASASVATVGGAVNSGAGGMRGAKYGTMRDWVLGLRVVLADEGGTAMWLGCRTVKCRQGYDLVRLIVGSEGTLAVVTDAVLRITPLPERVVTALAFFPSLEGLAAAAVAVKEEGVQPYIMEFLDEETARVAAAATGAGFEARGAMLLVSVDANREAVGRVEEWLRGLMERAGAVDVYTAGSMDEAEERGLFEVRRAFFPAIGIYATEKLGVENPMIFIEDVAVPPSRLVEAVREITELGKRYGLPALMGGHIGDGNLHPAVGFDPRDREMAARVEEWFLDVMRVAVRLGGTVSSEHGIGTLKKRGLEMELEARGALKALGIMREIKEAFDPRGILNPGKVV